MPDNTPQELKTLATQFSSLPEPENLIQVFHFVRDIAYGDIGSRNPFDVLHAKKGTCSGKHALLKLLFEAMGYEVQSFFAEHDFSKFPIAPWPSELSNFQSSPITDYHDFLKVRVGGNWITVDAIFDKPLEKLGFPVADWDGTSDMRLPINAKHTFAAEGDMEEHKKKLLAALPQEIQDKRKAFLRTLTSWLDAKRNESRTGGSRTSGTEV